MENETQPLRDILMDALRVKNISAEKLSQLSGVSDRFINALLSENAHDLPSAPYVRGYLIKIAEVLSLDGQELWNAYVKPNIQIHRSGAADTLPGNRFLAPKLRAKVLVIGGLILIAVIYGIARVPGLLGGSSLSISNIEPDMIVREAAFTVRGHIDPSDQLAVNGEILYPKPDGSFEHPLSLTPGFNTIEFKLKRFLGKEEITTKQIFYEAPTSTKSNTTQPTTHNEESQ